MVYGRYLTHLYHKNIIRYCNRPVLQKGDLDKNGEWLNEEIAQLRNREMAEIIFSNWNGKVKANDTVYLIGDFCFGNEKVIYSCLNRLNGKIKIVFGNHDKTLRKFAKKDLNAHYNLRNRVEFLGDYKEIEINGQKIILCHYPLLTWNKKHHNSFMLHGHCHYNLSISRKESKEIGKILDVGVDGNNFSPYSFEDIERIMKNKPTFPESKLFNDHHF